MHTSVTGNSTVVKEWQNLPHTLQSFNAKWHTSKPSLETFLWYNNYKTELQPNLYSHELFITFLWNLLSWMAASIWVIKTLLAHPIYPCYQQYQFVVCWLLSLVYFPMACFIQFGSAQFLCYVRRASTYTQYCSSSEVLQVKWHSW